MKKNKKITSKANNNEIIKDKADTKDIDWEKVDEESRRCLRICMEMDELDNNSK